MDMQNNEIAIDNYVFQVESKFSDVATKSVADVLASLIMKRIGDRVDSSKQER